METMLKKVKNFEEKMHRNASVSRKSSKQIDDTTYEIYVNYFYPEVFMETMLQKAENFEEKMHQNLCNNCTVQ